MAVHNSMSQRIAAVSEEEWPLEGGTWSARRDSEKKSTKFTFRRQCLGYY